nr:hypothetical protein [Corynebacterium silvaticum]
MCSALACSGRSCDDARPAPKPVAVPTPIVETVPAPAPSGPELVDLDPSDSLAPELDLPIVDAEPAPVAEAPVEPRPIVWKPVSEERERPGRDHRKEPAKQQCSRFERLLTWKKCS